MNNNRLEETVDTLVKEENPQAEAVKSLLNVKKREKGELNTEIELKTDLSEQEVKTHALLSVLSNLIEANDKEFSESCIIGDLIDVKERKALSKNRLSRQEIVNATRNPDMMMQNDDIKDSFLKRFFTSKQKTQQ